MTCLVVDDEPFALDLMEDNVRKVPFLTLLKKCRNAFEAVEILQNQHVDLVFLDIQMPGLTGIQLLKSLSEIKPMIIFVTAYDKYAIEGYALDVLDYLVKPVAFERFLKACNKAKELYDLKNQPTTSLIHSKSEEDYFFVNADYSHVKINIMDITHIEGMKDYIKIHLESQLKPVITRMSIKSMEEKLAQWNFIRIHKSYLVSAKKIEFIKNQRILIGKHNIPISENYKEEILKLIS